MSMVATSWTLELVKSRCIVAGDCWIWPHGRTANGLPSISLNGKSGSSVRRFVLKAAGKALKRKNWCAINACGEQCCVSPTCNKAVTRSSIMRAMWKSGARCPDEERAAKSIDCAARVGKLTAADVLQARAAPADVSNAELARRFGVARKTLTKARRGESYRHLPMRVARSVFDLGAA